MTATERGLPKQANVPNPLDEASRIVGAIYGGTITNPRDKIIEMRRKEHHATTDVEAVIYMLPQAVFGDPTLRQNAGTLIGGDYSPKGFGKYLAEHISRTDWNYERSDKEKADDEVAKQNYKALRARLNAYRLSGESQNVVSNENTSPSGV